MTVWSRLKPTYITIPFYFLTDTLVSFSFAGTNLKRTVSSIEQLQISCVLVSDNMIVSVNDWERG